MNESTLIECYSGILYGSPLSLSFYFLNLSRLFFSNFNCPTVVLPPPHFSRRNTHNNIYLFRYWQFIVQFYFNAKWASVTWKTYDISHHFGNNKNFFRIIFCPLHATLPPAATTLFGNWNLTQPISPYLLYIYEYIYEYDCDTVMHGCDFKYIVTVKLLCSIDCC